MPKGIDEAKVTPWLAERVGLEGEPTYQLIAGGRSNLTFRIEDATGRKVVLRRPPLGNVLATAHDVLREHRILTGLQGTGVPVPPVLAACDDVEVNGAPFYVMGHVDGEVITTPEQVQAVAPEVRERLADHLGEVLADLHAVDLEATGLSSLARHEGYVERQLKRWSAQWDASKTRELPAIEEVRDLLASSIPPQQRTTIAHGDYRIGNCLSDVQGGRIAAVLDWELCTLGDPLADLGYVQLWWEDPPGFPPFERVKDAYAARSGLDLSDLDFYLALSAWRLAVIAEGVYARYKAGVMGDDLGDALEFMALGVESRAKVALEAAHRHRAATGR